MSAEGAAPPVSEGAWQRDLMLIAMPALLVFAICLVNRGVFVDGDTNWHIATGRWIFSHHAIPAADPFSYTAFGRRWVNHEWLSEALMAGAWSAGGWSAVMLLIAASAAAAIALIAAELRARLGAAATLIALTLSFALMFLHILARPHMIALPLLALWTIALLRARRAERIPPLWLLPVMTLWANLHGSFIFGLAFTGPFALEAVLAARSRTLAAHLPAPAAKSGALAGVRANLERQVSALAFGGAGLVAVKWGVFILAATAMAAITPNGLMGLTYPFYVMSMTGLTSIGEWQAVTFKGPSLFQVALFAALFACLHRGARIGAARLGLLLLLLFMTLQHRREEVILAVAAPLLLVDALARTRDPRLEAPSLPWPPLRQVAAPLAVTAALFVALGVWRLASPVAAIDRRAAPVTALAHVPANLRARPVFNDYSFGGWLIFKGVRPFIDGRADMYGDPLFRLYLKVDDGDPAAVETAFRRYGVAWTILQPTSGLVARLDATPGWRRLYADKWAVVQARDDALPVQPGAPAP